MLEPPPPNAPTAPPKPMPKPKQGPICFIVIAATKHRYSGLYVRHTL